MTPHPPTTIREIRSSDLSAFLVARPATTSMGPYLLRQQSNGIGTGLVAYQGTELVGSLELCWTTPPEVRNVHVVDSRRNQGFGTWLLTAAEEAAVEAHSRTLKLSVGVENPDARRFYERLGYRITGERTQTTYSYLDAAGTQQSATEVDELMVKQLNG